MAGVARDAARRMANHAGSWRRRRFCACRSVLLRRFFYRGSAVLGLLLALVVPLAAAELPCARHDLARSVGQTLDTEPQTHRHMSEGASYPLLKAAKPLSVRAERDILAGTVFKECPLCPEMVVVPAGTFTMGAPKSEEGSDKSERPEHEVTFSKRFAVGRYAITFAEWDACVSEGGCKPVFGNEEPKDAGWGREQLPLINARWDEARAYVGWLSRKTNRPYRLLTEAEREYVSRAGTRTAFWWGPSVGPRRANYNTNRTYGCEEREPSRGRTLPVDAFGPNPWGLYNVHGNVAEWVEDCANDNYEGAPSDGVAWLDGDCSRRIQRGGGWSRAPQALRSASRGSSGIDQRMTHFGVRVARTLDGREPTVAIKPPGR